MIDDQASILFYCTSWCPDCRRARNVLDQNHIPYLVLDIEKDPEAKKMVERMNAGMRSVPTLVFPDGSILVEPSTRVLQQKLGLG